MRWEGLEPFSSRCHHDSGINKAESLQLVRFAKLSGHANRKACQGILCVSAYLPNSKNKYSRSRRFVVVFVSRLSDALNVDFSVRSPNGRYRDKTKTQNFNSEKAKLILDTMFKMYSQAIVGMRSHAVVNR